jgi:transcriptional regulator with XRE-family HTH domain
MDRRVDSSACFVAALNNRLKKGIHGDKKKLATAVGVTTGYISHLLAGKRQGSEDLRRNIAAALGYKYDQFLGRGYAILMGFDPDQHHYAYTYIGENTFAAHKQLITVNNEAPASVVNAAWSRPAVSGWNDAIQNDSIQIVRLSPQENNFLPQSLLDKLAKLDGKDLQKLEVWLDGYLAHKQ